MSKPKFFLKDELVDVGQKGEKELKKDVLFFELIVPPRGDDKAPAYEYIDRAKEHHVKQYPDAYKAFKKANPAYKLEWPELDVEVVEEVITAPVEVVEEVPQENT